MSKLYLLFYMLMCSISFFARGHEELENRAPIDFKSLFEFKEVSVIVELYGNSIKLDGVANYNLITFKNEKTIEALTNFFLDAGIIDTKVPRLIERLQAGVSTSSSCVGITIDCVLFTETEDFAFDANLGVLKIFVDGTYFEISRQKKYFKNIYSDVSFVNNMNSYAFLGSSKDNVNSQLDVYNKSTLSLPAGYVYADTKVSTSESELYEFKYNLDLQGYSLGIGYDWGNEHGNISSNLLNGQRSKSVNAILNSSKKLQKKDFQSESALVIFSAESAEIEIYRDNRLVYRGAVTQGNNFVDYKMLPTGSYDALIVLKRAGVSIKEEVQRVFNSNVYDAVIGEIEWYTSLGSYDEADYSFLKFGVASRVIDELQFGLGYELLNLKSIYNAYAELASADYKYKTIVNLSWDDHGGYYVANNTKLRNLFISYENLKTRNADYLNAIYGMNDFYTFTASYPFYFENSYLSINYSKSNYAIRLREHDIFEGGSGNVISTYYTNFDSVYLNYSKSFKFLDLNLNLQYSNNGVYDDVGVGLNVRIPFGDKGSISSSFSDSQYGIKSLRNTVGYTSFITPNTSISSDLSIGSRNELNSMLSARNANRYLNSEMFLNFDNHGALGASMNVSSTQIASSSGVRFTNQTANSFINLENVSNLEFDDVGTVEVHDKSRKSISLIGGLNSKNLLLPARDYTSYNVNVNTSKRNYINIGDNNVTFFTKPGAVIDVGTSFIKTNKYLIAYSNFDGETVNKIDCHGSGCLEVDDVAQGVFMLNLYGDDYAIFSGNMTCLLPPVSAVQNEQMNVDIVNLGKSYCIENKILSSLKDGAKPNSELYFLGFSNENNLIEHKHAIKLTVNNAIDAIFVISDDGNDMGFAGRVINIFDSMLVNKNG